jgi:quinol monooxygenase YgiN
MFAAVRVYEGVDPGAAQEIARRGQEGLVPLLRESPGFIRYSLVQATGGTWVSITLFQDQAGAEASTQTAAGWVRDNLAHLVQAAPRVITGEVVASSADGAA